MAFANPERRGCYERRFATELAREEARMLCDALMAKEAMALIEHDLINLSAF